MKPNKHDDLCPCTRFRAQDEFCTCGAVERAGIVADVSKAFGKRLDDIMRDPSPQTNLRGMIKRLEWVEGAPSSYTEIAESPFGHYSVWEINGTACWSPWKAGSGSIVEGGIEGAKAAAQADFEDRILSALITEGQP